MFLFFCFACSLKWNKEVLSLTWQINTVDYQQSLMVNSPPNHNSLKDYSLQQINNGDNRRQTSLSLTELI